MKCPNCNKEGVKYSNKVKDNSRLEKGKNPRQRYILINKLARCKKCNWEGEI